MPRFPHIHQLDDMDCGATLTRQQAEKWVEIGEREKIGEKEEKFCKNKK
ncbi:MAG: hypothetical protein LBH91_03375 [Prevotellaceae bacterium]|jgi:hypothetical protein|nr:hypothetical protein [Prevotellaceae bacterium]